MGKSITATVEFWGRTYTGIEVYSFVDPFTEMDSSSMSDQEKLQAVESFNAAIAGNREALEDLMRRYSFDNLYPEDKDEARLVDEFNPQLLLIGEAGEIALCGDGYGRGDAGFALVFRPSCFWVCSNEGYQYDPVNEFELADWRLDI